MTHTVYTIHDNGVEVFSTTSASLAEEYSEKGCTVKAYTRGDDGSMPFWNEGRQEWVDWIKHRRGN